MAQEITIIVLIDTVAAFDANQLEGNIYLIDNLRTEGSQNQGTGELITALNGTAWSNGSQANEVLLNWLIGGVSSLPPSLPRSYHEDRSRASDREVLEVLGRHAPSLGEKDSSDARARLLEVAPRTGVRAKIESEPGHVEEHGLKVLNLRGDIAQHGVDEPSEISHLPPVITNITGEAVDRGILYPAQYGTPIPINDGWYWSATASTHRPGMYSYTMHVKLYRFEVIDGHPIWQSKEMAYDSRVRVRSRRMVNGFTGGGIGTLPIR